MSLATASQNLSFAKALIHCLAHGGVTHAVISPGSRSTPLVLALADTEGITIHPVLDERVAGFVALGVGRTSGSPALLVCTSGSAAGHYLPAIMEAHQGRVPLLVLSADRPPELHDNGALQTTNQAHLFGTHVKAFIDLGTPSAEVSPLWLRQVAARSIDAALAPPFGPVHINAPFREPLWQPGALADVPAIDGARVLRAAPTLTNEATDALADQLAAVARGLIVCGPMPATAPGLASAVQQLGTALAWPVLCEPTSQVRVAASGSTVIAAYDALLETPDFAARHMSELVIRFGHTPTSKSLQDLLAQPCRQVLVDEAGAWHDPSCQADTLVVAEPISLCHAIVARLPTSTRDQAWLAPWLAAERLAQATLDVACTTGFFEGAVARLVARELPADAALHVANSMPIRELGSFAAPFLHPLPIYANRGTSGIDGTLATAAGEALGDPTRLHVVVLGDLAFLHDIGALRAAAQLGARLVVVVVNNGGGGIFSSLPIAAHETAFEPYFRMPQHADFEALSKASMASWSRVSSCDALVSTLRRALATARENGGLAVIDALVQHEHNLAQRQHAFAAVQLALASSRG